MAGGEGPPWASSHAASAARGRERTSHRPANEGTLQKTWHRQQKKKAHMHLVQACAEKFLVLRHAAACFYLHMWVPTHLWEIELTNKRQHVQHCWAEWVCLVLTVDWMLLVQMTDS